MHEFLNLHEDDDPIKMNRPYDLDWFLRFFDAVANISNEDMRKLWGKVLAGEVKQQGSFSLRTIETLRNIGAAEAACFRALLKATAIPVIFADDGTIIDSFRLVALYYIDSTIILQESAKDEIYGHHENCIDNSKIIDSYDIETQKYYGVGSAGIMQDCGLIGYAEREYTPHFSISNLGFIVGGDIVVVIKWIKPMADMVCIFRYKSLRYLEAARQLYPVVDAKSELYSVISIAKKWRNRLEHIKDYKFEISVHRMKKKIKSIENLPSHIDFEEENLLDTEYKS